MKDIINISNQLQPKQALIIYEKGDTAQWDSQPYYIEHHNINLDEQGKSILSQGKPLQKETIKELGKAIIDQEKSKTYLKSKQLFSENLLYFHQEEKKYTLIWYQSPSRQKMYFTKGLGIPTGKASVPTIVYVVKNNNLQIFTTKTKSKPTEKTKLYKAPFHNTGVNGNVCLGQGKKPTIEGKYIEELMKAWENVFWYTKFSEIHGTPINGDINELWRELINTNKEFPKGYLLPSNTKLNQLL